MSRRTSISQGGHPRATGARPAATTWGSTRGDPEGLKRPGGPPSFRSGFSLIEAVVVIAIMAILAGVALPLAVQVINQQAAITTRANAQVAYNAIFGARDHRVSNMMADFGYALPPTPANILLGDLVTQPAATVAWAAGPSFTWGWNGPYWAGSTTTVAGVLVPVDAWGRPFHLVGTTVGVTSFWQVVSYGADGIQGTADDIAYPSVAAPVAQPVLTLSVFNNQAGTIQGTVTLTDRNGTKFVHAVPFAIPPVGLPSHGAPFIVGPAGGVAVNPGPVSITVAITTGTPAVTLSQVVDLLPGQNYSNPFTIN